MRPRRSVTARLGSPDREGVNRCRFYRLPEQLSVRPSVRPNCRRVFAPHGRFHRIFTAAAAVTDDDAPRRANCLLTEERVNFRAKRLAKSRISSFAVVNAERCVKINASRSRDVDESR